jgi:hypothetical protein
MFIFSNTVAQITPSVYTGMGIVANLSSVLKLGGEVKSNLFSFDVAVCYIENAGLFRAKPKDNMRLDYDLGMRIHSKIGVFGGINYGYLEGPYRIIDSEEYGKIHGFSLSVGYRRTIYKHFYGLVDLGFTSTKGREKYISEGFHLFGGESEVHKTENPFAIRFRFVIGYEFNPIKRKL